MALNVWLSHQPQLPGPSIPWIDKAEHAVFFGILAWLLARAWLPVLSHRPPRDRLVLLITVSLLWAVSDEIHQSFIPGRSADALDVMADMAGAVLVATLCVGTKIKP